MDQKTAASGGAPDLSKLLCLSYP